LFDYSHDSFHLKREATLTIDLTAHDEATQAFINASEQFATQTNAALHALAESEPVPPEPPSSDYPVPPNVTSPPQSTAYWERDVSNPKTITNIHVDGAPDYGFAVMGWYPDPPPSPSAYTIEDVIGEHVGAEPPVMNGTGEAGLWFGTQMNVNRAYGEGSWQGMATNTWCRDSTFRNVKAKSSHVGAYLEHNTTNCLFEDCEFEGQTDSINVEWSYGGGGSYGCRFKRCRIYCPATNFGGFYLDYGTYDFHFEEIEFWGPGDIGWFPSYLVDPSKPNTIDSASCVFNNNGAKEIQYSGTGAAMSAKKKPSDWRKDWQPSGITGKPTLLQRILAGEVPPPKEWTKKD
jgi:hypothetical protein